jgi:hypothetical protein
MSCADHRPADVLPIADIRIGRRHRRDLGDIASLARDIDEIGLLPRRGGTEGGRA